MPKVQNPDYITTPSGPKGGFSCLPEPLIAEPWSAIGYHNYNIWQTNQRTSFVKGPTMRALQQSVWVKFAVWAAWIGFAAAALLAEDKDLAREQALARMQQVARFLADDQRQGRGIGTQGLEQAAQFIAEQFAQMGLKTDLVNGSPFQEFPLRGTARLGKPNHLVFQGHKTWELKLNTDFRPLALGGSFQSQEPLELVFVGYGITAPELQYDDYQGVDVQGKVVIVLRKEPQQNDPQSKFNGTRHTRHALFTRKVSNAFQHGAVGVILVNDRHTLLGSVQGRLKQWDQSVSQLEKLRKQLVQAQANADPAQVAKLLQQAAPVARTAQQLSQSLPGALDALLPFNTGLGSDTPRSIAVVSVRRAVVDQLLRTGLGKSLLELERQIDQTLKPQSGELKSWTVTIQTSIQRKEHRVKNVLALLPGEGPLAQEVIVLGAHYDHLGFGGFGSLAPGSREVHNGADDNASGTTVLLEVAHRLAQRGPLKRSVLFIAFTAEERGLIGSSYYVNHPVLPLKNTVAMFNLDMVGRLRNDRLILQGLDTAKEFGPLLERLNRRYKFRLARRPGGSGPSDHTSFYLKGVPVIHFFTGLHSDYHRPSDDVDKLNWEGMHRIASLVTELIVEVANAPQRPQYVKVARSSPRPRPQGTRPYFGSIPDFTHEGPGYRLMGVAEGSPAAKAGLRAGDVIVQLGKYKVDNLEDFDSALRKYKPGQKVPVKVRRLRQTLTLEVTLGDPR